jgi:hypothetical protein
MARVTSTLTDASGTPAATDIVHGLLLLWQAAAASIRLVELSMSLLPPFGAARKNRPQGNWASLQDPLPSTRETATLT